MCLSCSGTCIHIHNPRIIDHDIPLLLVKIIKVISNSLAACDTRAVAWILTGQMHQDSNACPIQVHQVSLVAPDTLILVCDMIQINPDFADKPIQLIVAGLLIPELLKLREGHAVRLLREHIVMEEVLQHGPEPGALGILVIHRIKVNLGQTVKIFTCGISRHKHGRLYQLEL